ncbi:MAG: hypothetical protein U1E28_19295 [Beijerinckiaceae bacterium]
MTPEQEAKGATERAAAVVEAATREANELRQTVEKKLREAGVDTDALALEAREKLTALEKLAADEMARRPLRTLAIAAGIGALIGAIIAR